LVDDQLATDEASIVASRVDPARFAEVFEHLARELHRYLSYRAGSEQAEELTAETFARAFAARNRFDPGRGSARAWLYGIATNVLKVQRRTAERRRFAQARERRLAPGPGEAADAATRMAERDRIEVALSRLDPKGQDVIYLIAAVGLSYEEAAAALGVPIGTVRSRYSRARTRMADLLAPPSPPTTTLPVTRSEP
jgi:RNA polymerase sigma factor (sigma-70 family)